MKICLGKEIEEIKKKNSEAEKNLLKNRNSENVNELDDDDVYFHSNAVKNIKLGSQLVNRIYLNNSIVYDLEDTIESKLFHSLVPNTATEIKFLYASNNPDLTNYQKIGYCDVNNFIEVWNNGTKYILINPKKNYIYAPVSCFDFMRNYTALTNCVLDNFDTSDTTNMETMFHNCKKLVNLDLSNFNTQNVIRMQYMFAYCSNLTNVNLSSFNTQNVKSMTEMFSSCHNLTGVNLSSFNMQNVTSTYAMFYNCVKLAYIISKTFNIAAITSSNLMFINCNRLVGGNGTTYSSSHITAEYARVDGENGLPGYFTAPANK